MQAIVFANRTGAELAPLDQHYVPALLPVGGKTVIEHCLDELQVNGITELYLVVDNDIDGVRRRLENGQRWSLKIHYILSRSDETPDRIRRRLGAQLRTPFLALRGDMLRGLRCWNSDDPQGCAWLDANSTPLGVQRIQSEPCSLSGLAWPLAAPAEGVATQCCPTTPGLSRLDSLAEYHRAALAAAEAQAELAPHGLLRGVQLRAGRQSEVHHRSLADGAALVGDYSRVHEESRLHGRVAIGRHCLIDRGARLYNSVVLDHTYVGAGVTLQNAIACPDRIIRVDLGADLPVSDPFLMADCRPAPHTGLGQRLLALLLLVLTLPLNLLAGLLALLTHPRQPLQRQTCYGNRRQLTPTGPQRQAFSHWRWQLPFHSLAQLPLLLAVVRGDLQLLGRPAEPLQDTLEVTQPTADSDQADHPWLAAYLDLPLGVWSPATLQLPASAAPELRQLLEIELLGPSTRRRRTG